MASRTLTQTQQSLSAPGLPGTWKLAAGRAITLQPSEPGILRVAHGQLWATFDGPHAGPLNDLGDHVVGTGERLRLRPGQRLVLETWDSRSPAYFSWDPVRARPAPEFSAVVQPLADLRLALSFGAAAAGRLIVGLAGVAWHLLGGQLRTVREGREGCAKAAKGEDPLCC